MASALSELPRSTPAIPDSGTTADDGGGSPPPAASRNNFRRSHLIRCVPSRTSPRRRVVAIAAKLDRLDQARVVVAAETGLRPEEWIALERRDLDRPGRALAVQRKYAKSVLRYGKNHRSRRRVPLTARTLDALEQLPPRLDTTLLFPAP
jgi:integrase